MTDKQLKKLSRIDLLTMMIEYQKTATTALEDLEKERKTLEETKQELLELKENYWRLCEKLDEKDAKLDEKDKLLEELREEYAQERAATGALRKETESLADSVHKLREMFRLLPGKKTKTAAPEEEQGK